MGIVILLGLCWEYRFQPTNRFFLKKITNWPLEHTQTVPQNTNMKGFPS